MLAKPWKPQKQAYLESLEYLQGRKNGSITSFLTPWAKVNDATTNGFEWHSTNVIGGRPGSGKTLVKDQIVREGFKLNKGNFRVLEFSLEMLGKNSAIRSYSSELGVTYKYLCSAEGTLSDAHLQKCYEYAKKAVKYSIDLVEESPTVQEFVTIVTQYMEAHVTFETCEDIDGKPYKKKVYTNTMVTLDHSLLMESKKGQKPTDMLYDFGKAVTALKRKFPIIFIILSQLNRAIDHPDRNEDGKYGNYVLESDIFGADALLQHADTVIGLNCPGKRKIRFYGPDRYVVPNDRMLAMHFLKCRNGENGICFFHAAFEHMKIVETPAPPQQQMNIRI